MWQWLGRDRRTSFLSEVLASMRLDGAAPGTAVLDGSPAGEIDAAGLVRAVRTQAATMADPKRFVFQARTPSAASHAYASLRDVTPSPEDLARIGISPERHRAAAVSPRAFLAAWFMSFPLTASPEHYEKDGTILRLMKADPVTMERFRAAHVDTDSGEVSGRLLLDADTLQEALRAPRIDVAGGAVVIGFSVRSCWDLQGLSHAIMGTVFHYRVVDLAAEAPRIFEVRSSVGGGSITGGLPDNLMAFELWREQTKTMEDLLARPELHGVLDRLDAVETVEERLVMLDVVKTRFARYNPAIALLHLGAMPYRLVQRYLPSARDGHRIGGRYVVKNRAHLLSVPPGAGAEVEWKP